MTRSYLPVLLLLSAIWGGSYLLIKYALRGFEPTVLVELRLLLAAPVLVGYAATRRRDALAQLWRIRRLGLFLGVTSAALPWFLISWGETHVDSGVAAVGNSSVPIFTALVAIWLLPSERVGGIRLAGILVGLGGVAVLAGVHPRGGWWAVAGTLAVVAASLSYAVSSLIAQRRIELGGPLLAAASMVAGAIVLLPFALAQLPDHVPGWEAWAACATLGVVQTGFAQLLLYRLIAGHGASRTMLVNYLLPAFALLYGVSFLSEPVTAPELIGLALILAGVALGAGLLRWMRRPAAATPTP